MAQGCPTPNYVRAVILLNNMAILCNVKLTFQSGAIEDHILHPGEDHKYERDINHGTWTAVDPITELEVTAGTLTNTEKMVATGVEIRSYTISGSLSITRNTPIT